MRGRSPFIGWPYFSVQPATIATIIIVRAIKAFIDRHLSTSGRVHSYLAIALRHTGWQELSRIRIGFPHKGEELFLLPFSGDGPLSLFHGQDGICPAEDVVTQNVDRIFWVEVTPGATGDLQSPSERYMLFVFQVALPAS